VNGKSHTIRRAVTGFVLTVAVAGFVVSSALASGGNSLPISSAGTSTTTSTLSQCPCNSGLVGGPAVSIPVSGSSIHRHSSFNWGAAGIGAGGGLALIALALGILGGRTASDPIKRRRQLARRLDRVAVPERAVICRGPRYIVRPNVSLACAPSLRAIAAALRNETLVVDSDQLQALEAFVGDAAGSPLFNDDPTAALREAVRLQHSVVGAESAVLDYEYQAIAV